MTTPPDPSRPAPPTVAEIAALTARLREISARGRDVHPTERARFLADKDALIARILDTNTDRADVVEESAAGPPMPEWMRERARRTEAEVAAGTYVPGPVDDTARLAARLAELRARGDHDDAGAPTARAHIGDPASPPAGVRHRDPLSCLEPRGPDGVDEQERRVQLARWYAEDHLADTDGAALVRGEDQ